MTRDLIDTLTRREDSRAAVWLDSLGYSRRVILGGAEIAWQRPAEFLNFHRQAHSLLRPSVATLQVGAFYETWLAARPQASQSMAGKNRLGFALKQLLADEEPRRLVYELLRVLRSAYASTPLVVSIPSPRRWAASVHKRANRAETLAISEDDVESASIYVTDWLRSFAESSIDGLLLEEERGDGQASAQALATYQPVINAAKYYRWALGVLSQGSGYAPGPLEGVDFLITDADCEAGITGLVIPDSFWVGESPPLLEKGFYYLRVPEDALPERVLERLALLR